MDIKKFSSIYDVRKLTEADLDLMLNLCKENDVFYKYCPPLPTKENLKEDLFALPPNKTLQDKFFVGFFQEENLVAICDLISGYPQNNIAYIGFFMMNKAYQRLGIGTIIMQQLFDYLGSVGFDKVELSYIKGNAQSLNFWQKQGFESTGKEKALEEYTKVVMQKQL